MSALQPPDDHSGFVDAVTQYAPIGGSAALVRALLSDEKTSWGFVVRRTLAASITASIIGPAFAFKLGGFDVAMACVGAVSYNAPEVWDWVGRKAVALAKSIWS